MQIVTDFTAIISDDVWRDGFGDQRLVLTYGFADALPDHQNTIRDQAFRESFSEHDAAAKAAARAAFDMWEDASALNFIEVEADQADLVLGLFDFDASAQTQFIDGFAFFPGETKISGDIFINETSSTSVGLYLHEIGHALGLEHPFEGDLVLPDELDTRTVTVMSSSGPSVDALQDFDVQAIQFMYGPPSQTPADTIPVVSFANAFISSRSFFSNLQNLSYGDTGTVTITVANFGEDAFGASIDAVLVLSRDEELDIDDLVIGSARVGDLAPNEQVTDVLINYEIFDSVPASLTADDYFVLVALDPTNQVAETREFDNVATVTSTTVGGEAGDNPGDTPPPFETDPRPVGRDPVDPPDDPDPVDPPVDPDPVDPPVDPDPVDPPVDPDPVDPPDDPGPVDPPDDPDPVGPPDDPDPVDPPDDPDPVDPPDDPDPVDPPDDPDPVDPPDEPEPVNPEPVEPVDPNAPTDGDDVLVGTNAADQIDASGGADNVTGGAGGDTLNGGGGNDTLIGGAGRDELIGGGGKDSLQGGGGKDLLIGNGGKDTLEGGGGADDLQGGGGKDLLIGGGGRDTLDGGGGKDRMEGGGGRDVLIGGRGADILEGGAGADRFVFDRGNGRDTITDFQQGRDKIVIEGGANDFDDLGISQFGDNVMIRFSNTRVIVEDEQVGSFTASDFIF